jgi:hypothetical protein
MDTSTTTDKPGISSSGAAALGLIGLAGAAFCGLGYGTRTEIQPGELGLCGHKNGRVEVIEPGSHWFGMLRFPNLQRTISGQHQLNTVEIVLTPATIDKLVGYGRKSLLVNLLPIIGDYTREKLTSHIKLTLELDYRLPAAGEQFDKLVAYAGTADLLNDGIARACYRALLPEEDKINRKIFAPKKEKLESSIAEQLQAIGLTDVAVTIGGVERMTVNTEQLVREYRSANHTVVVEHVK